MNEKGWLAATEPYSMFAYLENRVSDRKFRLISVACCRRIWGLLTDDRCQNAVEVAERYADGVATEEDLIAAGRAVYPPNASFPIGCPGAARDAAGKTTWIADQFGSTYHASLQSYDAAFATGDEKKEQVSQCQLIREIIGNPFRRVAIRPRWLTSDVLGLARGIYDDRAFDRLPILADALIDAGCDNADILDHCRSPGPHVRGCWVVDLLTGRS
jgi:hypothetical protein